MQKQEIKQEKMSADVLIIGGGIAGLTAAISVKEENPDISVLVVEKQTSGYSGKANKGGGVLQYFDLEKTTPEMFNEYHANAVGGYLANQNLLKKYVAMNNELLDKMESWGGQYPEKTYFDRPDDLHGRCGSGSYVKNESNCHKTGRKIYR